jgi:hypothetical protein
MAVLMIVMNCNRTILECERLSCYLASFAASVSASGSVAAVILTKASRLAALNAGCCSIAAARTFGPAAAQKSRRVTTEQQKWDIQQKNRRAEHVQQTSRPCIAEHGNWNFEHLLSQSAQLYPGISGFNPVSHDL